jgi:hypothetical protein
MTAVHMLVALAEVHLLEAVHLLEEAEVVHLLEETEVRMLEVVEAATPRLSFYLLLLPFFYLLRLL